MDFGEWRVKLDCAISGPVQAVAYSSVLGKQILDMQKVCVVDPTKT